MAQIDWNDSLDIDLPQIDEQHRKLIELSNGMIQAMMTGKGKESLDKVFTELRSYTEYHFADEEKFMEQIRYPELDAHRTLHRDLIAQVVDFSAKLDTLSPDEALDFINGWIVNHIRTEDVKVSLHAKK